MTTDHVRAPHLVFTGKAADIFSAEFLKIALLGVHNYRIAHRDSYLVPVVDQTHCDARWHHVYLFWNAKEVVSADFTINTGRTAAGNGTHNRQFRLA